VALCPPPIAASYRDYWLRFFGAIAGDLVCAFLLGDSFVHYARPGVPAAINGVSAARIGSRR
jgi:hypothetical protein